VIGGAGYYGGYGPGYGYGPGTYDDSMPTITATMAVTTIALTTMAMPPVTASSVSPEPGSVAKTAAGISVSK